MPREGDKTVRRLLAKRTAADHQTLHVHPWISSFADPALTADRYQTLLQAYFALLSEAEARRARLGAFPALTLGQPVANLAADLIAMPGRGKRPDMRPELPIADHAGILGMLYVIHGSGFGASSLKRNVSIALPDAPRQYLSAGTPPDLWRGLMAELEAYANRPDDLDCLIAGATLTFRTFGRFVTAWCEAVRDKRPRAA